ncbi:MAG: branched-chain amino acid ABC transporter permease [Chloroflexota bacterium]
MSRPSLIVQGLRVLEFRRFWIVALVALLLVYPQVMPRFWVLSIASQAMILGIIALSLIFLAGYVGMVSLAQVMLASIAGYITAMATVAWGVPILIGTVLGLGAAVFVGLVIGAISARSQGIYFLMLTMALAVGFFYLTLQNYEFFNGHRGFAQIPSPTGIPRADPPLFYYISLAAAALMYGGVKYIVRTPFGLALQGIRDNPRRMQTLGYWVVMYRIAAFGLAGLIAGVGGVLGIWYRSSISPGVADLTRTIDVLIIAVVGGLAFPAGAFVGAFVFILVETFASSIPSIALGPLQIEFDERFNTVIGLAFLLIVLFAPGGIVGTAHKFIASVRGRGAHTSGTLTTSERDRSADEPQAPKVEQGPVSDNQSPTD